METSSFIPLRWDWGVGATHAHAGSRGLRAGAALDPLVTNPVWSERQKGDDIPDLRSLALSPSRGFYPGGCQRPLPGAPPRHRQPPSAAVDPRPPPGGKQNATQASGTALGGTGQPDPPLPVRTRARRDTSRQAPGLAAPPCPGNPRRGALRIAWSSGRRDRPVFSQNPRTSPALVQPMSAGSRGPAARCLALPARGRLGEI